MKLKKRKKKKIVIIILLIFITVQLIIGIIGKRIMPVVENNIENYVNRSLHNYVFNVFSKDILVKEELLNIIQINKNSKEEIISVDYRLNEANKYLFDSMEKLYNNIDKLKLESIVPYQYKKGVFFIPSGLAYKNILLDNLGFKIPCMVNIISSTKINLKTKVSNYGINNILIELYLVTEIKSDIITPSSYEEFTNNFETIIASKIVIGNIPAYYDGLIEKSSAIISS